MKCELFIIKQVQSPSTEFVWPVWQQHKSGGWSDSGTCPSPVTLCFHRINMQKPYPWSISNSTREYLLNTRQPKRYTNKCVREPDSAVLQKTQAQHVKKGVACYSSELYQLKYITWTWGVRIHLMNNSQCTLQNPGYHFPAQMAGKSLKSKFFFFIFKL